MFLRFVSARRLEVSGAREGFMAAAYALRDSSGLTAGERDRLNELLGWFAANLPIPYRFNRSSSKGWYRRQTSGLSWFRDTAIEPIANAREVILVLEAHGCPIDCIRTERVGYILHEDAWQVVAEPFGDTPV